MGKDAEGVVERIAGMMTRVSEEFEEHTDFKDVFHFRINPGEIAIKTAIKDFLEDEQLNRIDDVFRALNSAEDELYRQID